MSHISNYVVEYGSKSFNDLPFTDIDNILLSHIFYMPFEKVITGRYDNEPIPFKEACNKMFAFNGYKHVRCGLILFKSISKEMMAMSTTKRFSELKMTACRTSFNENPAVQFAAVTFIMPDGTLVVVYRGTDDTLVGWKEDFDLYTRKVIPSHKLSVEYINQIAAAYDGDIIICGHSKGGNLALYSALNCDEKVRDRIKYVYNNDGPGFYDYSYLSSNAYKDLLPRYKHFVPSCSLIGMLLAHDNDYQVVKSSRIFGAMQHDPSTWLTRGVSFYTRDDLKIIAKVTDLALRTMIFGIDDEHSVAFDKVLETIVEGIGQVNLTNFARNLISSIKGAIDAWSGLDEKTRTYMSENLSGAGKIFSDAISTVRNEEKQAAEEKIEEKLEELAGAEA